MSNSQGVYASLATLSGISSVLDAGGFALDEPVGSRILASDWSRPTPIYIS
ncbi:MAG: hypothetical protein ABSE55_15495 [Terracidiphilus sp.]